MLQNFLTNHFTWIKSELTTPSTINQGNVNAKICSGNFIVQILASILYVSHSLDVLFFFYSRLSYWKFHCHRIKIKIFSASSALSLHKPSLLESKAIRQPHRHSMIKQTNLNRLSHTINLIIYKLSPFCVVQSHILTKLMNSIWEKISFRNRKIVKMLYLSYSPSVIN